MNEGISPEQLGLGDKGVYIAGCIALWWIVLWFVIEISIRIGEIHRRYNIGKQIEEAEEAKEVS